MMSRKKTAYFYSPTPSLQCVTNAYLQVCPPLHDVINLGCLTKIIPLLTYYFVEGRDLYKVLCQWSVPRELIDCFVWRTYWTFTKTEWHPNLRDIPRPRNYGIRCLNFLTSTHLSGNAVIIECLSKAMKQERKTWSTPLRKMCPWSTPVCP